MGVPPSTLGKVRIIRGYVLYLSGFLFGRSVVRKYPTSLRHFHDGCAPCATEKKVGWVTENNAVSIRDAVNSYHSTIFKSTFFTVEQRETLLSFLD